jgi:hypothetical protein
MPQFAPKRPPKLGSDLGPINAEYPLNPTPKPVVTSMAGFAVSEPVITSMVAFALLSRLYLPDGHISTLAPLR